MAYSADTAHNEIFIHFHQTIHSPVFYAHAACNAAQGALVHVPFGFHRHKFRVLTLRISLEEASDSLPSQIFWTLLKKKQSRLHIIFSHCDYHLHSQVTDPQFSNMSIEDDASLQATV